LHKLFYTIESVITKTSHLFFLKAEKDITEEAVCRASRGKYWVSHIERKSPGKHGIAFQWSFPEQLESYLNAGYEILYEIDKANCSRKRFILRDGIMQRRCK